MLIDLCLEKCKHLNLGRVDHNATTQVQLEPKHVPQLPHTDTLMQASLYSDDQPQIIVPKINIAYVQRNSCSTSVACNSQTERQKQKNKSVMTSTDFESLTHRGNTQVEASTDQEISRRLASLNQSIHTQVAYQTSTRARKVWMPAEELDLHKRISSQVGSPRSIIYERDDKQLPCLKVQRHRL